MPTRAKFRINRQLCAFVGPVTEFGSGTVAFSDIDIRALARNHRWRANGSGERSMRRPSNPQLRLR